MPASSADGGRGVCRRRRVRKMEENRCFRQTGGREAASFCRIRQHNRIGRGFGIVSMRIPADEIADCRMTAVRYGYVKSSPFGLLRINVTTRLRAVRRLILFLVEEEIVLRGVIGPDVFDRLVNIAFVLYFLQVFKHFQRRSRTNCVIDQLLFGRGPRCIFQFRCEFKCPVHNGIKFLVLRPETSERRPQLFESAKI